MSKAKYQEQFDKYLTNICTINRKVLRKIFDIEKNNNIELEKEIKQTEENDGFFIEDSIDFSNLIVKMRKYVNKNKFQSVIIQDTSNDPQILNINEGNKKQCLKLLDNSSIIRNDIWHNAIEYDKPEKYYKKIKEIKDGYNLFKTKSSFKSEEKLLEKSIQYLEIALKFFGS